MIDLLLWLILLFFPVAGIALGTTLRNNMLTEINTTIGASALLRIYTGSMPTNAGDAATGTLLGTMTFSATPFGSPASGVVTANAISNDVSADNTGTAGYWRIWNSAVTVCSIQGTIGTTGSGAPMEMNSTSVVTGAVISCTSATITMPAT